MAHVQKQSSEHTLILLTDQYPYGKGETFLEPEMLYNTFPTLIFSYFPSNNDSIRPLPPNCRSYLVNETPRTQFHKKLGRLKIRWRMTTIIELWRLLVSGKMSRTARVKLYAFIANGRHMYRYVLEILSQEGVKKDSHLIFYAYWMHSCAYAALLLQKHYPNSSVISRCHGHDLYQEEYGYIPMRKYLTERIQHFYPIAEDGYRYLMKRHGVEKKRITTARLGTVDMGVAIPSKRSVLRIVSCSNIIALKRIPLIIEALSQIDDIQVMWEHFGTGKEKYINMLKSQAKEQLGQLPNIQYKFQGVLSNTDYLAYCKDNAFHLFVNVSSSEGVPVSIMEALSLGTPVMATDVGGTHELISSGENGILLPKNVNPAEIADAFRRFYEMPDEQYEAYRENARNTWESKCDASNVFPAFYSNINKWKTNLC